MKAAIRILSVALVLWFLLIGIHIMGANGWLSYQLFGTTAHRLLTEPVFELGSLPVTPIFIVKATIFMVLLAAASRFAQHFLRNKILSRTSIDTGLQYALQVGTGYFIFIL